jgi:Tfp pilus assembly protein PilW
LAELLIVLAITGIVTTGMYSFFLTTYQTYNEQAVVARMLQTATTAMTRITQDIREAGTFWASPCAKDRLVMASNDTGGSITIRVILDDPPRRTEIATNQPQTNATFGVLSIAGYQVNDTAYISDGVQCTQFTVTGIVTGANPGLQHEPAKDWNSAGGAGYTYPLGTSMVGRIVLGQEIGYAIDTTDPKTPWLTRNSGSGAKRLVPDVESLNFSYVMNDGTTVNDPTTITAAQAANVRTVIVRLRVKADTRDPKVGGDGFRRHTLVSTVKLRNLGS